jgi:FkbM family methyltransferase
MRGEVATLRDALAQAMHGEVVTLRYALAQAERAGQERAAAAEAMQGEVVTLRDALAQAEREAQECAAAAEAIQCEVAALWDTLAQAECPAEMRHTKPSIQTGLHTRREQEVIGKVRELRIAGEYETAKQACRDYLVSEPDAAVVLLELAGVLRACGELHAARQAVDRSLAVDSSNLDARLLRVELNRCASRDPTAEYFEILHRIGILNYEDNAVSGESNFLRAHLTGRASPVVFDVGAFEGTYALDVLDKCPTARIYAFEPNPRSYARLERCLSGTSAITFPFALGGLSETAEFFDYSQETGSQHATLHRGIFENVHRATPISFPVEVRPLDDVIGALPIQSIALLKIDVEGHEFEVLRGAQDVIRRGMVDVIQFEFNEMNAYSNIFLRNFIEFLPEYKLYRLLPNDLLSLEPYRPIWCEIFAFQNIICVRDGIETPILRALPDPDPASESLVTKGV